MPAKVEGRDQPEKAKETMAPFKSLLGRLLRVPMSEVKERQRLYEDERTSKNAKIRTPKMKKKSGSLVPLAKNTECTTDSVRQQKK
jgi:hypothetical protein